MKDELKTKTQLIEELQRLRSANDKLERDLLRHASLDEMWRRYEFIVNTSREFLSLIDAKYKYVAVNNAYCGAHNKKRDEIIGRSVAEIWGEDVFDEVIKSHLDDCFRGREVNYESKFSFAAIGDRIIDVTYYPYHNRRGTVTHTVVISRDVTEQKAAEKELLALKKAVETMQLGVTITDTSGKILYTNPAEASMHGYNVEEMLNGDAKMLAPKELWKQKIPFDLNKVRSWRRESVNLRKDRSVFPVQLMSDVVRNASGDPICVVTTCEDITERKKTEEQIQSQLTRLTALREIDMVILSSLDMRVVLKVLLTHLKERLNVDAALIMTLNQHSLFTEYAESVGFRSMSVRNIRCRLGEGPSGQIALERLALHIANLRESKLQTPFFEEDDFVSYMGVPLIAKGNVKGTLEVFKRGSLIPEPEWLDFLETLANQAAIAMDNATMFNDIQRSNIDLALAYDSTLDGWSRALDLRDRETEGHSQRVAELTVLIARAMGIGDAELVHIRRGALLHDIGKLGIPDSILHKPGPLTDDEWEVMRMHPVYAFDMLSPITFLRQSMDIPYCHHEKWDGTGYPRGLKGDKIPMAARIFSIADIWDALCSDRPYRSAYARKEALEHIKSYEGSYFDPAVLSVFLNTID